MRLLTRAQPALKVVLWASGFRLRSVETAAATLRYLEHRAPPAPGGPVVFLHGIASSASSFGTVLGRLRGRVPRIVALDAPGHGFSDAPRAPLSPELYFESVAEALDAIIDEPALLVGNSLGGAMALRYAAERPENVRALVTCSPGGAPAAEGELEGLLARFDLRGRGDALAFLGRLYHRPPWYAPLLADDVHYLLTRPAVRQFFAAVTPGSFLKPGELAAVRAPALVIWGKGDRLLAPRDLAFFREHLPPGARFEEPDHFGHSPQLEWPIELAERILRFDREAAGRA
ncbi:MAG TPA: alpha/beta fold hydrolase [Polyangiaceae bacterium]|nr:alpha/beta fold hydrolase [Polyangiaceae bacterium]